MSQQDLTRPRIPLYPAVLIGIIVLAGIAAFVAGRVHQARFGDAPAPTAVAARVTDGDLVRKTVAMFMRQMRARQFGAQWTELASAARGEWPSKAARTRMLAAKFDTMMFRYSLGKPAAHAVWESREATNRSDSDLWRVPVTVRFARPGMVRPGGVAGTYRNLALYVLVRKGRALIVGEGPAAIDAPVIVPARVTARQVHVPILMYHLVGPFPRRAAWDSTYGYDIEYGLTVTPAQFRAQMAYLKSHGYTPISFPRLADALLYGLPLPKRPVALTFDDGRLSPYDYAAPVLRRYGFTATFFICAGFAGQTNQTPAHLNVQRYLSWAQMALLSRQGFWIEDHGVKDINELYDMPMNGLRVEVGETAREIETHTGVPVQFVAYTGGLWPYPTAAQSDGTLQTMFGRLSSLGYVGAVTDTRVPGATELSDQLLQLPRVRVQPNESVAAFAASLQTP